MTKTNKRLLTLLFAGFLVICAGFALLLTRPASSASAEETAETPTYSETWVINSSWHLFTGVNCSLTINGKVESVEFSKFTGSSVVVQVIDIATQKTITLGSNATGYVYYNPTTNLSIPYSEWKDTYGKVTFYEDTSTEKFSDLRAWLEAHAVKQTAEEPEPAETYSIIFYDERGINILYTKSGLVSGTWFDTRTDSALQAAAKKNGYTLKGWTAYSEIDNEKKTIMNLIPVSGDCKLCAVYESNTEPTDPTDPTDPENPNDSSFEDKVKDFGDKASTWIKDNIGITLSGSAVIIILIVAALVIVFKRK